MQIDALRIREKAHGLLSGSDKGKTAVVNNKAFGFEQFDVRLSGVEVRIKRAAMRIEDYLAGRIERIEELEEPRLWHWEKETPFANEGPYAKITGIGIAHI